MSTQKPICVLTETDWIPDDAIARLETVFDVRKGPFNREELVTAMQDAVGCFVGLDHMIDQEMFGADLRFIASPTTGLNHIDLDYAEKRNVEIVSLKGEVAFLEKITATAELCWGLIISLLRHIPEAASSVNAGEWDRDRFRGTELQDATLGIIGYGRLGRKIAQYAKVFDMNVLANSPQNIEDEGIEACDLQNLLERSDIVTLQANSCPDNYHMIGGDEFACMQKSAFFINTARGDLVDETALLKALENKDIAGAALDVIEEEFNDNHSSQNLIAYAKNNHNLIITPHIGGATYESQYKTTHFVINKLLDWWENDGSKN